MLFDLSIKCFQGCLLIKFLICHHLVLKKCKGIHQGHHQCTNEKLQVSFLYFEAGFDITRKLIKPINGFEVLLIESIHFRLNIIQRSDSGGEKSSELMTECLGLRLTLQIIEQLTPQGFYIPS